MRGCFRHFNPRSREGSDRHFYAQCCQHSGFQSTLPRRERLLLDENHEKVVRISIHAPAKGATRVARARRFLSIFQSTLPRRERRISVGHSVQGIYFNPRSREGSDPSILLMHYLITTFQSTLPRRERLNTSGHFTAVRVFQSTLPRRERRSRRFSDRPAERISIHAPAKGATV